MHEAARCTYGDRRSSDTREVFRLPSGNGVDPLGWSRCPRKRVNSTGSVLSAEFVDEVVARNEDARLGDGRTEYTLLAVNGAGGEVTLISE